MKKVINISSNGIKQAIDDLVNENEILQDKVYKLEEQLQQKENIIKEVREYIVTHKLYCFKYDDEELFEITTDKKAKDDLLNILHGVDKEFTGERK